MARVNERIKKAQDIALEFLEYIIDVREARDFIEIVGCIGGDVLTYRVYDDGSVYAK